MGRRLPAVGGMLTERARACQTLRGIPAPSNSFEQAERGTQPRGQKFPYIDVEGSPVAKRGFDMDDDNQSVDEDELPRISTGNSGLDDILGGGIDPERMYLVGVRRGRGM